MRRTIIALLLLLSGLMALATAAILGVGIGKHMGYRSALGATALILTEKLFIVDRCIAAQCPNTLISDVMSSIDADFENYRALEQLAKQQKITDLFEFGWINLWMGSEAGNIRSSDKMREMIERRRTVLSDSK